MSQSVPLILNDDVEAGSKDNYDIEEDFAYRNNVANATQSIRLAFIKKVYGLLTTQIFLTVVIAGIFMGTPQLKDFIHQNDWMIHLSTLLSIGVLIALFIKRRETPMNLILLAAFTVIMAFSVGTIVTYFSQTIVIQALVLTLAVLVGLTAFTFQTKYDFSAWHSAMFAGLCVLMVAGFMQIFIQNSAFELLLSAGGAIMFSLFIVIDTQMIIQHLSPEEYILATITLYLDIINLFIYILRLLQETNR